MVQWFVGSSRYSSSDFSEFVRSCVEKKSATGFSAARHGAADGPWGWKGLHVSWADAPRKNLGVPRRNGENHKNPQKSMVLYPILIKMWGWNIFPGGGFRYFSFHSYRPGERIQFDYSTIFKLAWNDQTRYPISYPMFILLSWNLHIWNMNTMCWNLGIFQKTTTYSPEYSTHEWCVSFSKHQGISRFFLQIPSGLFWTLSNLWHGGTCRTSRMNCLLSVVYEYTP